MDREHNPNNPCTGACQLRSATCHSECEAYLAYRAERLAVAEARRKRTEREEMMSDYGNARFNRIVKNRHTGGRK